MDRNRDTDMMKGFSYHPAQHDRNSGAVTLKFNDTLLMPFMDGAGMVGMREKVFVIFEKFKTSSC